MTTRRCATTLLAIFAGLASTTCARRAPRVVRPEPLRLSMPPDCWGLGPFATSSARLASYPDVPGSVLPPPGWYDGDTHDHAQPCVGATLTSQDLLARMLANGLEVSSGLIWNGGTPAAPFVQHVCRVTGSEDPLSSPTAILQYGVETSGLGTSTFGHLIGLDIGPGEARIADADPASGACYSATNPMGLACPGPDGTGYLAAPVARFFAQDPDAVLGYAHQAWTLGIYHPNGYDWSAHAAAGYSTDVSVLDPSQRLSFPPLEVLFGIGQPPNLRPLFPLLGPVDAALGNVDFLECGDLLYDFGAGTGLPARWFGMLEKLLVAGLPCVMSGGSDNGCRPLVASPIPPRTYARLAGAFGYREWSQAIRRGRVSVAEGDDLFLDFSADGQAIGDALYVAAPASVIVEATVVWNGALTDTIEVMFQGDVVASLPVEVAASGSETLTSAIPLDRSGWLAAKLRSGRAYTGPCYVYADSHPIADALTAEYWMVWCDALTKTVLDNPGLAPFSCQQTEALDEIAAGRRVFRALRDVDLGFDPSAGLQSLGVSTPACRGPMALGATGPARPLAPFTLTCLNAPPESVGTVFVSSAPSPVPGGLCERKTGTLLGIDLGALVGRVAMPRSTRSGYAEVTVLVPALAPGTVAYAQILWRNAPGCAGIGCTGNTTAFSASDVLRIEIQP
jgi:hypothetical protein